MIEALNDQVELNSLVMTDNKRHYLADARARLRAGVQSMQAMAGMNGTPAVEDEESGITNRSPRTDTTNNNYPVRSDAPWVALMALLAVIGAVGWLTYAPKPTTPQGTGSSTSSGSTATGATGKSDPNYIEFYKP